MVQAHVSPAQRTFASEAQSGGDSAVRVKSSAKAAYTARQRAIKTIVADVLNEGATTPVDVHTQRMTRVACEVARCVHDDTPAEVRAALKQLGYLA